MQTCRWAFAAAIMLGVQARLHAAETTQPQYPISIAVDAEKSIFIADRNLPGVWRFKDGKAATFFSGSKKPRTPLNAIRCLALDVDGKLLAGDSGTRDIYRFNDAGEPQPLTAGGIGMPMGIASTSAGDLLVADLELHCIWRVPKEGGKPKKLAEITAPRALFVDRDDRVWVVSHGQNQLMRFKAAGDSKPDLEIVAAGRPFQFPCAIVVNGEGVAFVCDTYAKAVWKVVPGKEPEKWVADSPLLGPVSMAWQAEDLLVVDPRARSLVRIDTQGKATSIPFDTK